jgi:hypothetical protein
MSWKWQCRPCTECTSTGPYQSTSLDTQDVFYSHVQNTTVGPGVINQQEEFGVLNFIFKKIRKKMMDLGYG